MISAGHANRLLWICPPGAGDGSLASLREGCRREGFVPHIRFEMPSGSSRPLLEAGHAIQLVEPGALATDMVAVRTWSATRSPRA